LSLSATPRLRGEEEEEKKEGLFKANAVNVWRRSGRKVYSNAVIMRSRSGRKVYSKQKQ
jgi:hypothetical protein